MDQFERAILCRFDPQLTENIRKEAENYCTQVTAQQDGWKPCLELFFKSDKVEVKFFCLQVLQELISHKYLTLSEEDKSTLKLALTRWPESLIEQPNIRAPIKNKYAQVVAMLFRQEYPEKWPTFFKELFAVIERGQPVLIDIFSRIMDSIDEIVVSFEFARNAEDIAKSTLIKDYMREDCVPSLAQAWYQILISFQSTLPDLAKGALGNLKRYINWIDINLVANDHFVQLFFQFLKSDALRKPAIECLNEIVVKGMDPANKLLLLEKLQLKSILSETIMVDDPDYQSAVAKLVCVMGTESINALLKVPPELRSRAKQIELDAIQLLFVYFNHEYDDVSEETFLFVEAVINQLKHEAPLKDENLVIAKQLLQIIANKMRKVGDSDEEEFLNYCKGLTTMFRNISRISPELAFEYVQNSFQNQLTQLRDVLTLEVTMQLLLVMSDGMTEAQLKQFSPFFSHMITALVKSNIYNPANPIEAIGILYFELIIKYSRFLPPDDSVTITILTSFFDSRGIKNPVPKIRSRAAYLFVKLAKGMKMGLIPFAQEIFAQLRPLLVLSPGNTHFDDQIYLFEAASLIIGGLPEISTQNEYIQLVMSIPVQRMEEIVSKGLYKEHIYVELLIQCVSAISTFTKGLGELKDDRNPPFTRAFEVMLMALTNTTSDLLKSGVIVFTHVAIEGLGKAIFPYLPSALSLFLQYQSAKDIMEFIRLINQLIVRFKEDILELLANIFMDIVSKTFALFQQVEGKPVQSEEVREVNEVRKLYFALLQHLVAHNCSAIFSSPKIAPHLSEILRVVIESSFIDIGRNGHTDLQMSKTCIVTLGKLVESWGGTSGFNQFVYYQVIPTIFTLVLKPEFNANDAIAHQIMGEATKIQRIIFKHYGNEFIEFLKSYLSTLLGFTSESIQSYLNFFVGNVDNHANLLSCFKSFVGEARLNISKAQQQQQQQQQGSKLS